MLGLSYSVLPLVLLALISVRSAFSPDQTRPKWLASTAIHREVTRPSRPTVVLTARDTRPGLRLLSRLPLKLREAIYTVAFSPDLSRVATADGDRVQLWDAGTWHRRQVWKEPGGKLPALAFSPDGQILAAGFPYSTAGPRARLWTVATGQPRMTVRLPDSDTEGGCDVAFSPDGRFLLTAFHDVLSFWDLRTTQCQRKLKTKGLQSVESLGFSPDGQWVAGAPGELDDNYDRVRLWNLRTGRLRYLWDQEAGPVTSVAFSANSRRLASGGDTGTVTLWDVPTGRVQRILRGRHGPVGALAFSPDGQWLVSSVSETMEAPPEPGEPSPPRYDGEMTLWDLGSGKALWRRQAHLASVTAIAFSPNGQTVASGSYYEVKLWHVTGRTTPPDARSRRPLPSTAGRGGS